ncbi:MAG: hypothetical protein M1819_007431 [Sarea resinae]|nr:MAG: hypothetical protein M1819_007431 [Sarea resinae]
MAFTPSSSRMNPTNSSTGLRLTHLNTSSYRNLQAKSPCKSTPYDSCLSLRQVIGTTTCSAASFDCLPWKRLFASTAGAAAIVIKVDDDLRVCQRFFRARPTAQPVASTNGSYYPSTPTPATAESRTRTVASLRDAGIGYSAINSPMSDWGESPSSKTWSARERVKAATSVSFSPDGKFLAVGETGYKPRVLIFSLAEDASSDIPLAVLSEHGHGVRCVAFSPNSQFLASLGTMNDGFLYIWAVNPRTGSARLLSSNKCTSHVRHMAWMGNKLVTVGTRHVKVWRVEDPVTYSPSKQRSMLEGTPQATPVASAPKSLPGKNCLLGSLIESTFTCVAHISHDKAIICTEKGDVCLLDDSDGAQRLSRVAHAGFPVNSVTVESGSSFAFVGGINGNIKTLVLEDLTAPRTPTTPSSRPGSPRKFHSNDHVADLVAMGSMGDHLVTVDTKHAIKIIDVKPDMGVPQAGSPLLQLPAHPDAVRGVRILPETNNFGSSFFTWSAGGIILFWSVDGTFRGEMGVELEQLLTSEDDIPNELKVVQASPKADFFVSGDKYGVLRVIDGATRKSTFHIKAHGGEITDIAIYQNEKATLIASCARDRMVQLFRRTGDTWDLIQTLDEHVGAIGKVLFLQDGEKLLSCSSDRTVVIRELMSREVAGDTIMAYSPLRILTLKATPISMATVPGGGNLIVSTIDRQIQQFDITSGRQTQVFKATDQDGNDAVVMDALLTCSSTQVGSSMLLAGVSTTDKSIRIYDLNNSSMMDKVYGHTAGVTDVALLEREGNGDEPTKKTLISTGCDGTVMIWDIVSQTTRLLEPFEPTRDAPEEPQTKELTAAKAPLRRVLSRSELAEFQKASQWEGPTPNSSPSSNRSPPRALRKKTSRFSLATTQRPGNGQIPPLPTTSQISPIPALSEPTGRKGILRDRSPTPPSPKNNNRLPRRPSFDGRSRTKSAGNVNEFGTLNMSTEQVCRTLRAYRRKLNSSSETVRAENVKELERELSLTARALGDKAIKTQELSETVVVKLLDQYSDKLVEILDQKIAMSLAKKRGSDGTLDLGTDPSEPSGSDIVGEG